MARALGKDEVIILRAPLVSDTHGNKRPDWAHPVSHAQAGCYVEDGDSSESLINRDEVEILKTVFAPPATDVLFSDHVSFGGIEYQVHGTPRYPKSFSGKLDYCQIALVKWEG